jgi:hypothetical protein
MLATSVASNVESTLAFTLSVKIVDLFSNMQTQSYHGGGQAALFLSVPASGQPGTPVAGRYDAIVMICTGAILFSIVSGISSQPNAPVRRTRAGRSVAQSSKKDGAADLPSSESKSFFPTAIRKDMKDIAGHVLLLAFSRIVMQQFSVKAMVPDDMIYFDAAFFDYAQTIIQLVFTVIILSCILAAVLPRLLPQGAVLNSSCATGAFSGSLANRQLNSLMVNVQRTFAETVASFVTDVQTRKLIVLMGLCMLPIISAAVSGSSAHKVTDIRSIESFFLASSPAHQTGRTYTSNVYANFLAKLWISGLSMAWMNTTLGFILPNSSFGAQAGYYNAFALWMRVVSTACLAVLSRSLQPMFPGIEMFQSYIEWSIATSILASLRMSSRNQMTTLSTVFLTGLSFYAFDAFYRDVVERDLRLSLKRKQVERRSKELQPAMPISAAPMVPSIASPLQTLHSISVIMFTNSLVSWSMETISGSHGGGGGLGQDFATIVAGIVVARTIVQVVDSAHAGRNGRM